jgi:hypothetical protein
MYNRYIPRDGVYTRVPEQDIDDIRPPLPPPPPPLQPQQQQTRLCSNSGCPRKCLRIPRSISGAGTGIFG